MNKLWIGISAGLAVVCIGLLVWALSLQSDVDDAQQETAQLQAQIDQASQSGGDVKTALKAAYDSLAGQIGATQEDVAATQQRIDDAAAKAESARTDAQEAAQRVADDASSAAEKAKARLDQMQAQLEGAQAQAQIAADCGKAYWAALGSLLDGDSITSQLSSVRDQIQEISADCRGGTDG